MIATSKDGRYLVECHIPLSFIRESSHLDSTWSAFAEWRDAINGVNFQPDARRYGAHNKHLIQFWVEEVGSITYKGRSRGWGYFEMYIRCGSQNNLVYETLCGLNGPHFFLISIQLDPEGSHYGGIRIKKFLTPVLVAKYFPRYEEAMNDIFEPFSSLFQWTPDPSRLPTCSLR